MLTLTFKPDETLHIGCAKVFFRRCGDGSTTVGIEVPQEITILHGDNVCPETQQALDEQSLESKS